MKLRSGLLSLNTTIKFAIAEGDFETAMEVASDCLGGGMIDGAQFAKVESDVAAARKPYTAKAPRVSVMSGGRTYMKRDLCLVR